MKLRNKFLGVNDGATGFMIQAQKQGDIKQ